MIRTRFDSVCKNLIMEMADNLGFQPIPQFNIDPQKRVEQSLGFVGTRSRHNESVDVVWNFKLASYGTTFLANEVFANAVVAWEVDSSSNPHKSIKSSIDNLDGLNPRLGVELLLIGTTLKSIKGFEKKFNYAVDVSRHKKSRIIVIHDVFFAMLYNSILGRHPEELYEVYINACKTNKQVANALKKKVEDLLKTSKVEDLDFKKELEEKLIDRLQG